MLNNEGLVEADFQRFYHLDYRDLYRPAGGGSKLTLRRAVTLAAGLPPESLLKSEDEHRTPISGEMAALYRIEQTLTGEQSPMWDIRTTLERKNTHDAKLREARARARAHNDKAKQAKEN